MGLTALAIVALWVIPALAFPNPGFNDAFVLVDLSLPVLGAILLGSLVVLIEGKRRHWLPTGSVALGTFLIGVALVFLIGLVTFGNLSDDRFMLFPILPVLFFPVGIFVLAVGLSRTASGAASTGLMIGGIAAALLLVGMIARAGGPVLLTPYGLDELRLIALGSTIVYVVGIVALAVALRRTTARAASTGLMTGGIAAALLLAWTIARGPRDWLLAPYGFDVLLLIALESAIVYVAGATWRQQARQQARPTLSG